MSRAFRFRRRVLVAACAAFLFLGCLGPKGVKVTGKIVENGQAYTTPQGGTLSLSFKGGEGDKEMIYPATISPDGSFVAAGEKNAGVPPGKYKVAISFTGGSDPDSLAKAEQYNGKFAALNGQEIQIEDPAKPITIDVGAGTIK